MKFLLMMLATAVWAGPLSREVSFVEAYSSSEVTLKSSGLGEGSSDAIKDLKKAAIWYLLEGGTDPILTQEMDKSVFKSIEKDFYKQSNIAKFITWEASKVTGLVKLKLPNGDRGVKLTKMIRINKSLLVQDLVEKRVIKSQDDLSEAAGMPTIMVIPDAPEGQAPLDVLSKNELAKHASGVIESFLTAKKYDVIVPSASEQINNLVNLTSEVKSNDEDLSYQIALSVGSDIYLTYSGEVKGGKASVVVKAFETTTGRLLGTETGYSKTRPGAPMPPLVEEAINDAINNVLQRINSYWNDDLKKGMQYKLIVQVGGSIAPEDRENAQFEVQDAIEVMFGKFKENIVTDKTLDYLVWAPSDEFASSSSIYRQLKRKVRATDLQRVSINRKLIILKLEMK
jgi:hypothetical protein